MRAACGNSGNVDDNKSLYWHPTVYRFDPDTKLYHTVPIYFGTAYYVWKTGKTAAFPDGFGMIAKQSNKARVLFDCNGPSPCDDPDTDNPRSKENCKVPKEQSQCKLGECFPVTACAELEIKIVFPSCWNNKTKTSYDHMEHVAYTEGTWGQDDPKKIWEPDKKVPSNPATHQTYVDNLMGRQGAAYEADCPATHPVRIPEIQLYFRIADYKGGHHVFSDGSMQVHADYLSGWDEKELQKVLDACENDSHAASADKWCESTKKNPGLFKFRDMPKKYPDPNNPGKMVKPPDSKIVEKLKKLQPNPPLDLQKWAPEKITGIPTLPRGKCKGTIRDADPADDWKCKKKCGLLGPHRGDRSGTCRNATGSGLTGSLTSSGTAYVQDADVEDDAQWTWNGAHEEPAADVGAARGDALLGVYQRVQRDAQEAADPAQNMLTTQ